MRLLDWRVVGQLFLKASSLQRKRATLTVAAIAWGTVAIIMLLSFGEGLKIQLMKGRRGMGENIAVWWPDETSKVWQGLPEGRPIRPRVDDIDYLRGRMTAASGVIGEITSWSSSKRSGSFVGIMSWTRPRAAPPFGSMTSMRGPASTGPESRLKT